MANNSLLETAHSLRRSGQIYEAIKLYEKLLSEMPNNLEYIFGKAMCFLESDPLSAVRLFKKVIDINPNVPPAYGNIVVAAKNANNYTEAITIFNDVIKKYPENYELYYHRAILLGNNGDNHKALIDCYYFIEHSSIKDNPHLFSKHSVSSDIAFGKVQLRNQTLHTQLNEQNIYKKYKTTKLKEYQYKLPTKLMGDENYYIEFGKYMGNSINEILKIDPQYLIWCILNVDEFCLSEEILILIKSKGLNIIEAEIINTAKLHLLEQRKLSIGEYDD
jgi:hypothetical protein